MKKVRSFIVALLLTAGLFGCSNTSPVFDASPALHYKKFKSNEVEDASYRLNTFLEDLRKKFGDDHVVYKEDKQIVVSDGQLVFHLQRDEDKLVILKTITKGGPHAMFFSKMEKKGRFNVLPRDKDGNVLLQTGQVLDAAKYDAWVQL